MVSLVYLTTLAPSKFSDELMAAGYRVWEALSVSEVLHLCEHERVDAIVIAPGIEDDELLPLRLHHITIWPKPRATAKDLIWDLEQLFPSNRHLVH